MINWYWNRILLAASAMGINTKILAVLSTPINVLFFHIWFYTIDVCYSNENNAVQFEMHVIHVDIFWCWYRNGIASEWNSEVNYVANCLSIASIYMYWSDTETWGKSF